MLSLSRLLALALPVSALATVVMPSVGAAANSSLRKSLQTSSAFYGQQTANPRQAPQPQQVVLSVADIETCVESLCGPAKDNYGAIDALLVRAKGNYNTNKEFNNELAPLIQRSVTLEAAADAKLLARFVELLKSDVKPETGHPLQAVQAFTILNTQVIKPYFQQFLIVDQAQQTVILNRPLIEMFLMQIGDASIREALREILNTIYAPSLERMSAARTAGNPLLARLKVKYPKAAPAEALAADAKDLLQQVESLKQELGAFVSSFYLNSADIDLLQRGANGVDLLKNESTDYVRAADTIETFKSIILPGVLRSKLSAMKLPIESMLGVIKSKGLAEARLARIKGKALDKRIEETLKICKPMTAALLESEASEFSERQFMRVLEKVKQTAKDLMPRLTSPGFVETARAMIDATEFVLPTSPRPHYDRLKQVAKDQVSSSQVQISELDVASSKTDQAILWMAPVFMQDDVEAAVKQEKSTQPTQKQALVELRKFFGVLKAADAPAQVKEEEETNSMLQACRNLPVESAADHAVTSQGRIFLSWYSLVYRDVGLGIVSHELGHIVSAVLKSADRMGVTSPGFFASRQCVSDRNPFAPVSGKAAFNSMSDSRFTEEDWADYFSGQLTNAMAAASWPYASYAKNHGCALINDYGDVYKGNTPVPDDGDPHSSGFLRLLLLGMDRKQTTRECQPLIGKIFASRPNLNCDLSSK